MVERFSGLADRLAPDSDWKPVTATIIDSTYHYARLRDLISEDNLDHSFFLIRFRYVVDGKAIEDKFEQAEPLESGSQVLIFYNPKAPDQNTFQKPKSGLAYWIFVGVVGLGIGLMLIFIHSRLDVPDGLHF